MIALLFSWLALFGSQQHYSSGGQHQRDAGSLLLDPAITLHSRPEGGIIFHPWPELPLSHFRQAGVLWTTPWIPGVARLIDSEIVCTVSVVPPCWREVGAVAQGVIDCGRLAGIRGVRSGLSRLSSLTPTNTYTRLVYWSVHMVDRSSVMNPGPSVLQVPGETRQRS